MLLPPLLLLLLPSSRSRRRRLLPFPAAWPALVFGPELFEQLRSPAHCYRRYCCCSSPRHRDRGTEDFFPFPLLGQLSPSVPNSLNNCAHPAHTKFSLLLLLLRCCFLSTQGASCSPCRDSRCCQALFCTFKHFAQFWKRRFCSNHC